MAIETKVTLKSHFERGDQPTSAQFSNLIDSMIKLPVSGDTAKNGFIEVVNTAESTAHVPATLGRNWLLNVETTAQGRDLLAITSASALGGGTAGLGILAAEVTASVVGLLGTIPSTSLEPFPAGTAMLFHQGAAPTGWTQTTAAGYTNAAFRSVATSSISTGGADEFTSTFGASVETSAHVLTTSEIPSHSHGITFPTSTYFSNTLSGTEPGPNAPGVDYTDQTFPTNTDAAGSDGGHTHGLTNMNLKYVDVIVATKD